MKVIYQYPLKIAEVQTVRVPASAEFLFVDFQGDKLYTWAQVHTDYQNQDRIIRIYETGQPIAGGGFYIGSACSPEGVVWHVYEG